MSAQALRIWYRRKAAATGCEVLDFATAKQVRDRGRLAACANRLYLRVLSGQVRYYQIAYIDPEGSTHYASDGESTFIERIGLCEVQKDLFLKE